MLQKPRFFTVVLLFLLFIPRSSEAKNVIFFIGDGMGPAYVTAARYEKNYREGKALLLGKKRAKLWMDRFPYTGIVQTYPVDDIVTDSAASATAMATGHKTKNKVISRDVKGKDLLTIAEKAKKMGKAVGIVTTTEITHATPAAFYAHVARRDKSEKIGRQLLETEFDVFLGGGAGVFQKGKLKKGLEEAVKEGKFKVVRTKKELLALDPRKKQRVLGLFSEKHMTYVLEKKETSTEPTLVEMMEFALKALSRHPGGFFLMVEGGRIDHGGHDARADLVLEETLHFDEAVGVVYQAMATKKYGLSVQNTLTVVTADHETAGLAINGYLNHGESLLGKKGLSSKIIRDSDGKLQASFPVLSFSTGPGSLGTPTGLSSASHTAVDVHVYGYGRMSDNIRGTMENTDFFDLFVKALQ